MPMGHGRERCAAQAVDALLDRAHWRTVATTLDDAPDPFEVDGFLQATLDSLAAHVAVIDAEGTVLAVNRAWSAFSAANGGDAANGVGANYFDACRASDAATSGAAGVAAGLRAVLDGTREQFVLDYPCHGPTGLRWFALCAARFVGAGDPRLVVQHQEVTARREAEAVARFHAGLLDAVDAAVVAVDAGGCVTSWNRGAERLYGWSGAEALGRTARELLLPDVTEAEATGRMAAIRTLGHWEGKTVLRRKDGTSFPAWARNAILEGADGCSDGYVGVAVDITEQLRDEAALRSAHDYAQAVAASMGEGLCTLDEDGRVVYLNPKAEELLGWTTAELAGQDVHAMVHHTCSDGSPRAAAACPLVQARLARSAASTDDDDTVVRRDGSVVHVHQVLTPFETGDGVVGFVLVITDITERKREARDAERKLQDLGWIERIRHALDHDRFVLHAQPIVELATGRTVQHELLLRMLDDDGTAIAPGKFLPVAEAYGLIGEIDRWVIRKGIGHAARGRAVELNLSAHSLSDPTLYAYVDAELAREGTDPALVVFELTETALLRDEDAALRFVTAVAERGCGLALDDFGTGYGGFSYLKRLPVDYLKIDIEFVRDLATDPASRRVVEAVVSLARGFGIKTVAEGVEDAATLELLAADGVDYAQGYHLGRPALVPSAPDVEEQCAA